MLYRDIGSNKLHTDTEALEINMLNISPMGCHIIGVFEKTHIRLGSVIKLKKASYGQ